MPTRAFIESVPTSGGYQITVNHVSPNAGLEIHATLRRSQRAYGNGTVFIKNVGHKPIVVVRCEWVIKSIKGDVIKDPWTYGGATSVGSTYGGLAPGDQVSFPIPGPPNEVFEAPDTIKSIGVSINGMVYGDQSYWGEDGYSLYAKLERDVKDLALFTQQLKQCLATMPTSDFVKMLKTPGQNETRRFTSIYAGINILRFRRMLLDNQGGIVPDAMQKLDQVLQRYKSW